jgi:transposase
MAAPKPPKLGALKVPDENRSQKDLLKELEYLRAENAYLKKLDALIQEKKAAAQKKRS